MTSSSTRSSKRAVRTARPRSVGGVIGGVIGALAMSVVAGVLVTAAVTPVVAISGMAASSAINLFQELPTNLNPGQLAQPSTILAKQGDETVTLATFYAQNREMVSWDNISQYAKDAAVATEDPRFYTHGGVDVMGVGRAAAGQVTGRDAGGASTITMQYVRNVLVQEAEAIMDEEEHEAAYEEATKETFDRKLQEMRYAISIEKKYTKDEILLGYLNIGNFGGTVYGIEAAAQYYYNTTAKDLTLSQAASLVGIVQYPSDLRLDIEENLESNENRRNYVLQRMLDGGKITQAQHDEAVATPLEPIITPRAAGCAVAEQNYGLGHFCDYVQLNILHDPSFGNTADERNFRFLRGGFEIMTTIDLDMQRAGLDAMHATVPAKMDGIEVGSASVSTEVGTGRVLAMVQNRPFAQDPTFIESNPEYTAINYNTDFEYGGSSGFQVGSTFKAVTLAEWLRAGNSLREIVNVEGRTVQESSFKAECLPGGVYGWGSFPFHNDNLGVRGNQTVMTAVAQSLNGGLVSMQQRLDLCNTFRMAEDLGIQRASDLAPSADDPNVPFVTTLNGDFRDLSMVPSGVYGGVDEIAPITMALAFGAFASGGTVCTATPIDSIIGPDGEDVPFTGAECHQAISADVAAGVTYVLEYGANNVSFADHARSRNGIPHFAKTGTTDDVMDNWTVGGSSKVTTATWIGNAEPFCWAEGECGRVSTLNFGGYGGLQAADQFIWPAVMDVADWKYGGDAFPQPNAAALKQTMVTVPDVRGRSFEEADRLLTAAGFTVTDGGREDSSVADGLVSSTEPSGGSSVGAGAGITVKRSNASLSDLPNVVGQTYETARSTLASAGFSTVSGTCESGGGSPDDDERVTAMNPAAGSDAKRSNRVTLTVDCS